MVDVKADQELLDTARTEKGDAKRNLETAVKRAYQHVMYLDMGEDSNSGDPRVEKTITFEHENQTSLDGQTVWLALVEASKAFGVDTFTGKALVHNLVENDYDRPLDEVRDLFWNAPRMPLLPGGDADLQRAVYQAVIDGSLRLIGADGTERHVTSASEIGVGQSSLRLAKPIPVEEPTPGPGPGPGPGPTSGPGPGPTPGPGPSSVLEKQISFALRSSLSVESRDQVRALLLALGDRVDDENVSYAEVMIKIRINEAVADELADLARQTGVTVDVRDV